MNKPASRLAVTSAALLALLSVAHAANEGRALGVDPDASVQAGGAGRTLVVGADVSVGERIVTGPSGEVQLLFVDNTRLVVGPGSALLIETYLLRGGASAERVVINALGGTYRFVSGQSPSTAYEIKMPAATIGVRGTAFDFVVAGSTSAVVLYQGAITLCAGGQCTEVERRCDLGVADGGLAITLPQSNGDRNQYINAFRYMRTQSTLLSQFRVGGANACYEGSRNDGDGLGSSETNSDGFPPGQEAGRQDPIVTPPPTAPAPPAGPSPPTGPPGNGPPVP